MLIRYFKSARTIRQLRSGMLGDFMDGFATVLHERGHTYRVARCYVRAAAHLGAWLTVRRAPIVQLEEERLTEFGDHLPACCCQGWYRGRGVHELPGARLLLGHLRETGTVPFQRSRPSATSPLTSGFAHWMRRHRGATRQTIRGYLRYVPAFIDALGDDPSLYEASGVRSFLLNRASGLSHASAANVATSIRMFLRYLSMAGYRVCHLVGAVPTIANWSLASLPRYLASNDVEEVIKACGGDTLASLRDRAVILLLCRLGLRAGDVAGLRLDDIDWSGGRLQVEGKSRRETWLPLPQDAGDAILDYLDRGRPSVARNQRLFLGVRAPHRPLASTTVSCLVRRVLLRSGVKTPFTGAHLLRHSAATELLRKGASLGTIGIVLRHRSIESTAHYAKVDFKSLYEVTQPWPGEVRASC